MSTKVSKRRLKSGRSTSRSKGNVRRGRRSSSSLDPVVWIAAVPVAIIAVLLFSAWQSGAFAKAPEPSRSGDPASLQPLADAGRVLRGGYNVALKPERTPAPQPAPVAVAVARLHAPTLSHDFGRIYERWDVTHIFAVQNTGDADLVISNLVTSCGCTVAELSSNVIPPGQRADLAVTFDADFHETSGEVTRLVWFATNDPTQPWVEVRVTADVR